MRIGEGPTLNSGEGVAQCHRHLAGSAVTDGEFPIAEFDLRHRGNNGGGSTGEDLGDIAGCHALAPFLDVDLALFDGEAGITGQLQQRISGDSGQQRTTQLRSDQAGCAAAAEHEEQVHPAHLFDVTALDGIEPHHLITTVRGGLGLGEQ